MFPEASTNLEHLQNFRSLPFHLDSYISHFPSIDSCFIQVPVSSSDTISHSLALVSRPFHTQPYRRVTPTTSPPSSPAPSATSTDSLPPLEPVADQVPGSSTSDTVNRHLVDNFFTLSIADPPHYSPSGENPPHYDLLQHDVSVHRRILFLERECADTVAKLRELRASAIAQLSADIDARIAEQVERYQDGITRLRGLLVL